MKKISIRWWYIPLFLLVIAAFVPTVNEISRGNKLVEQAKLAKTPVYTLEKIREEFSWVKSAEINWGGIQSELRIPSDPSTYWEYLDRRAKLNDAIEKFLLKNSHYDQPSLEVRIRYKSLGTSAASIIQHNFQTKFGRDEMMNAKPTGLYIDQSEQSVETNAGTEFMSGYFLCIPIMFLIFIVRLKVRELLVAPELLRLMMYSVIWPIGLMLYPKDIRREEQMKQWMYLTAQLASAVMGLFGFMPLIPVAKAQPNKGKGEEKSEKTKKVSFGNIHYGFEYYPSFLTNGPDKGSMLSPWYSVKDNIGPIQLSHSGFVEVGEKKSQLFSNNGTSANWDKAPWLEYRMETGFTATNGFLTSGVRVMFNKVPGLGKMLNKSGVSSLGLGRYTRVRGPSLVVENVWYWAAKPIKIGDAGEVIIDGFYRVRPGVTKNVGQPQMSFRPKKFGGKFMITFEAWVVGDTVTPRFGLQFSR